MSHVNYISMKLGGNISNKKEHGEERRRVEKPALPLTSM